jgi:hypothetical protein
MLDQAARVCYRATLVSLARANPGASNPVQTNELTAHSKGFQSTHGICWTRPQGSATERLLSLGRANPGASNPAQTHELTAHNWKIQPIEFAIWGPIWDYLGPLCMRMNPYGLTAASKQKKKNRVFPPSALGCDSLWNLYMSNILELNSCMWIRNFLKKPRSMTAFAHAAPPECKMV